MASEHHISVVIPYREDPDKLNSLIDQLRSRSHGNSIKEIIIVLNGALPKNFVDPSSSGTIVLNCTVRQRAAAMNVGAATAKGDILYFLHADSLPPEGFDENIGKSYAAGAGSGCFLLRFDSANTMLRVFCYFVRLPWYWVHFGDQSLYVDAGLFRQLGGYDERLDTMEDIDMVRRIKKLTSFRVMPAYLTTSARKYERHGYFRVQMTYVLVVVLYLFRFPQSLLLRMLARLNNTKFADHA
jgi:Glycosyl transferase family 2